MAWQLEAHVWILSLIAVFYGLSPGLCENCFFSALNFWGAITIWAKQIVFN